MDSFHRQAWENTSDMMLPYTLDMLQEELSQLSAIQKRSESDRTRPVLSMMNAEVPGLWRSQYETIPIEILPPNLFQVPDSLGGGIPMESHNLTYHYPPVAPKSDEGQPTGNPESSHDGPMLNFSPGEVMRPVTDDDTRVFKPLSAAAGGSPFEPFYPPLRLEAVPSHHLTNPLRNVDFQQYDIPQLYLTPQESSQSKVLQPDNEPQVHTRSERTEQQESSGPRVPTLGSLGRVPVDSTPHITLFRGSISPVATLPMSILSPTPVRQGQHQGIPNQTPRQPQVEFVPESIIPPSPSSSPGIAHSRAHWPQGFQPLQPQVDAPATGTPRTRREPWYSEAPHTGFSLHPLTTSPTTVVPPAASVPNGQTIDDHAVPQPQQPQLDVDDIREILDLLRRNDRAQKIALDQQREVIRHLSDMNSLLERDAVDRQIDMTSLAAGLVSLPDEVAQRRPLLF